MFKFSKENMQESLDNFGECYNCPIGILIFTDWGLLKRRSHTHFGYAAITDSGCVIISEYEVFQELARYTIPLDKFQSVKVRRTPFRLGYNIKLKAVCSGKITKLNIFATPKINAGGIDKQPQNLELFLKVLSHCSVFKGKI